MLTGVKAAGLALHNRIRKEQQSRPPQPEPRPGTRYAEPLHGPLPTRSECEVICSKCSDPAARMGLGDPTYSACIELDLLKFKNKKRAVGSDANQALVLIRKIPNWRARGSKPWASICGM